MPGKISLEATKCINHVMATFSNLLKEFPKNATEDFSYDDSTLNKISQSGDALTETISFFKKKSTAITKENKARINKSLKVFSLLMAELPKNPEDEFSYDRMIHQLVEDARETVAELAEIIP